MPNAPFGRFLVFGLSGHRGTGIDQKLQSLDLSMRDVLGDTMLWLNWGQSFGSLSGHESKLEDEELRQILTTFAYGTGLGRPKWRSA